MFYYARDERRHKRSGTESKYLDLRWVQQVKESRCEHKPFAEAMDVEYVGFLIE